jgi:hypothetical protein
MPALKAPAAYRKVIRITVRDFATPTAAAGQTLD